MSYFSSSTQPNGVHIVEFSNPPYGYLPAAAQTEFAELVPSWDTDEIRVVVVTGADPGVFIPHSEIEELLPVVRDRDRFREHAAGSFATVHDLVATMRSLPKPIVFGLTGDTMGGGLGLALAGDLRVAQSGDHRYGMFDVRLGVVPGGGGSQLLSRMLGPAAALDILLRGRIFPPEEALRRGLVHEVADDARARAIEIAGELAALPATTLGQIKRAVNEGYDLPFAQALEVEADASFQAFLDDETVQALETYVALPPEQRRAHLESAVSSRLSETDR